MHQIQVLTAAGNFLSEHAEQLSLFDAFARLHLPTGSAHSLDRLDHFMLCYVLLFYSKHKSIDS